jgi:RNA polymerase sigma-70 factor (sigma-E family)
MGRKGGGMPPTFEEFAAARLDPLLRYATALTCDAHLAEDVVQEVLLRVQQRWTRISGTAQPAAYVKRMILNEYLSWRRRKASRDVALAHADLALLTAPVADTTGRFDERQAMAAKLATLPRKQRAAVVLRYYEELDDAEIAVVLGCSAGTVRSHISRALGILRARGDGADAAPPWPATIATTGRTTDHAS